MEIIAYEMRFQKDIIYRVIYHVFHLKKKFQHKGYGKQLLLWGMQCIRKKNTEPIVLHVAEWNKNALLLYKKNGFEITNIEKIR